MEVLCYYFALLHLLLFVPSNPQPANGQGVSLELNGSTVPNFGLLGHSDIDISDDAVANTSLVCRTDNTSCCRGADNTAGTGGFGDWFYPGGDVVAFSFESLPTVQIYQQLRGTQVVRLYRNGSSGTTTANGIYRCEVADQNGVMQTRYVGLYTEGAGVVSISEAPQFSLISEDPLEFTLTSTTTGGPPTTAKWTLPNDTVITAGDGFTQTLLNATTATVEHTLTVTGRMPGVYTFSTTNSRSGAPDTSSITVQAANPPTGLMAVQNDATSILVSWTAPASGGDSRTGYRIFYQTGGGSVQNVTVGATATSHTLTGLQSGATYSISIEAHSNELPSARVGPETVTFRAFEAPTVMTEVLGPTSIRVTFTQPNGSLAAKSYDIQYTRVIGAGQTLCGMAQDTGATTDVQSPFTITNLEEFSSYNITVTARVLSAMRATTEQAIMTSPAVPSGPPQSVMTSSITSSSITVQWGPVSCIDRNSEITGYTVQYRSGGTTTVMELVSGTSNSDRMFTASGLIPRTSYTFEVAAVSSEGTGPFNATTVETTISEGIALQLNGQRYGNNSHVTLTDIGEGDTAALLCLTDRVACCRGSDGGAGGDWYFPDGGLVPFEFEDTSIYQNRGASRVRLNRRNNAQSPTGVYRCEIPDASRTNQRIYVGVVTNANSAGSPTITTIQFELTSATDAATPSFTLNCITAGAPVDFNDITWTRAGSSMPVNHGLFQVLVNGSTATYNNTLAVTGRETGQYTCRLQPPGGTLIETINVEAADAPTGLMAVQDGLTSILVSWTAPASGGASRTGYRIFYQTGGGSVQSVDAGAGATSHTLNILQSEVITYSISIVALSNTLPSTVVGPETVEGIVAPTVTAEVLNSTSIKVTFTQPSGTLAAESYDIQYTRVTGAGQTLCASVEDTGATTDVQSPVTITSLEEFSSYDITVTARAFSAMRATTEQAIMTSPAAPAAAPRDLVSTTVLSTSITVGWDPVECIERNGEIDNYIVRFGPENGVQSESTVQSGGVGVAGIYNASGLNVSSSYNFSVAAMNSAGIGPFTPPLIVETSVANPPTGLMAVQSGLTSVLVSWTAPASDSSVITDYRITYTSTGGSGPQSVTTGPGATSHTLSSLESGATYNITIVSLIGTSSSSVEGPVTVTVRVFEAPTVTPQVLSPTSIRVTFTQPSGTLAAESYDIQYTRVTGAGQTLCGSVEDTNTTTDVQSPFTITNLEEFSSYDITVTARAFSTMLTTTERAMTSPAVPSGLPQSVMTSSVNSSSITVQWGRVSCIDRNSEITGYTVRYGQTGSTTMSNESVLGTSNRMFTASGLIPRTSYTFEVAAVSSEGTGPFSIEITVKTTVPEAIALQLSGQRYGNHSLVTLTDIGDGDTAALLCLTDRVECCKGSSVGGAADLGEWYFPDGGIVPDGLGGASIYRNRRASRVQLNRRNNAQSPTGVYRCEVPDANGTKQNIYVGVYQQSSGNLVSAAIVYNGTSNTLICTSTGGPATTVSWRKDNVVLDKSVRIFQIITNATEATYDNVLQFNGTLDDIIGSYSCNVSNNKSTQDSVHTIQGLQISGHEATLQLGESYSITCTTDLEVAIIEWLRLDSATMEAIEVGNSSPLILELQGVDSTLNGASYTCRTTSPHGVQERSISLTVELRSSTLPIGAAVGAIVGIGLVLLLLLLAVILWCIICRKKRRGKFTLFDRVRSKRGRKSQSYGVPYDVRGSGIDGAMELKGVGEEEEEGKDDDYFEDSAALAMDRNRSIPLPEFGAHVKRMHNDREKKFELEFDSLIKHPQFSVDIAQIPVNRDRNRFGNIFPYNTNRVTLNEIPGVNGSDYINASYIEGYNDTENAYVAAQGPLPNSIEDFWRMIWEQKLSTVVMLTKCFEGKAKCEKYWPENLKSTLKLKNNLVISMTEVLPFTEYEIRKLKVQDTSKPSEPPLAVTQLHYTIWPDHGAPGNAMSVINFIKRVRRVHPISSSTRAPLLVHCSAGVGRTGTFIVLDVMLQRIKDMDNVNVYAFITELRTQRVFMVQSLSQYVFIHDAIDELITCGESEIAAANIRITINRLTAFGVGGMTGFQQQFQNLQRVSPKAKDVDFKVGRSAQNVSKNRYQENVVSDLTRVRVSPAGSGCSDYINAVFVEGYRKRGAYISTQGPMEETVSDFWRMVWEYQSKCIVMLCKLEENGEESCYCYWPTQNGASAVYGKLKVTLRSQETCMDYVVRKLEVTDNKQHPGLAADGGSPFVVTQFQFSHWSPTATPATFALLEVVDKMTKVQMTSGNKAITVMCNDGVGRTGAFITVHTQLERLKTEGMVDVFQSIKAARIQRAGLVQSVEQYIFCHNALEDFLDSFETYANFKELV